MLLAVSLLSSCLLGFDLRKGRIFTEPPPASLLWLAQDITGDSVGRCSPAQIVIGSGPRPFEMRCTDDDAALLEGWSVVPEGLATPLIFRLSVAQLAADTGALHGDGILQCKGPGEVINNTWSPEVSLDFASLTGSDGLDQASSAQVTPPQPCNAGDLLFWRWAVDAAGTTTAMGTLLFLSMELRTDD